MLRILSAKTLEEARVIGRNDKIMENAIRTMESWLADHSGQKAFEKWTEEKMAIAEEKGLEQGLEQGLENGLKKTAKNMLYNNENIEKIIAYTGLTKKQIEALK